LVEEGEYLPADLVLLASSAENGECFVQTSSLDGERTLKHKQCQVPMMTLLEKQGLTDINFMINCENPTKNLYEFTGFIESPQFPEKGTISLK
jgi:magnesium-transporting ATPase (P-type)